MATKKMKRFREGGSEKDAGLEASKDDKVGFFERLRMGNIDEEGSEAYNRFGAGRGRAAKVPVEDRVATPVNRTKPEAAKVEVDELEAANAREPIPVSAGPRSKPRPGEEGSDVKIGGKPSIHTLPTKQRSDVAAAIKRLNLDKKPSKEAVASAKARLGLENPTEAAYKPRRKPDSLGLTRKPGTNVNYENEDATSEPFKKGGAVRGWGMARGARKAKMR